MKDKYPDSHSSSLPECSLRTECIQMVDEIDALQSISNTGEAGNNIESALSKQRAAQLAEHIRSCEVCQAAVNEARAMRDQQRGALQCLLSEGEMLVPSTTADILGAIRNEQMESFMPQGSDDSADAEPELAAGLLSNRRSEDIQSHKLQTSKHIWTRTNRYSYVAVVAAAAVFLFVSMQMFQSFYAGRGITGNSVGKIAGTMANVDNAQGIQSNAAAFTATDTWSSVVVSYVTADGKQRMVDNYDPTTGKATPLLTASTDISVDGVSHSGHDLIYHSYDSSTRQTTYHLLSGASVLFNGKGLNAVWSQSDSDVFVVLEDGSAWKINVKTVQPQRLPFNVQADKLAFIRNQYLYYIQGKSLYRIDVDSPNANTAQRIVTNADIDTYWLNLNNETVYYVQNDSIYEVPDGSPGMQPQLLAANAIPIGYDENTNLETMSWDTRTNAFELHAIDTSGVSNSVDPDVHNVVPGAVSLCSDKLKPKGEVCNNSIALSPYGKTLVLGAKYTDNTYKIVSVDLMSHNQTTRTPVLGGTQVELIGWDKLVV